MSRRVKRPHVLTQFLAVLLVLSIVRPGNGAPGDVFSVPAPMLGSDPPAGAAIRDGDASVSTQTGAFQYAYPITVPPGRLGNEPSLALSYSSQGPIYGGIAAGWSLSIPEIQRDTADGTLVQFEFDFDQDQREGRKFLSTMAGSRPLIETDEPKASGVYATFRAQNDTSYARYEWMEDGQPFHWRVYTPDGTTHYFGDSDLITGTPIELDRVPLTRTVDEFGNTVTYQWVREGNGLYIDEIEYTSNPDEELPPFARVRFSWNAAPTCGGSPVGSLVRFQGGYERLGGKTLALITATSWDPADERAVHTRQFALGYDASVEGCALGHAPYRQLQSIQESAEGPAQPRVDLPPVTFTYGVADKAVWQTRTHGTWTLAGDTGALSWGRRYQGSTWPTVDAMMLDFDGDGLVDRLRSSYDAVTCRLEWDRNTGTNFAPMPSISLPHLPWGDMTTPATGCSLNGQRTFNSNLPMGGSCGQKNDGNYLAYRWLDVDSDGLPDLVTAIHYDANIYDPNVLGEAPFGPWPACQDAAASLLLQERCMTAALVYCDGEACGFDGDRVADCLDDPDNEYETVFKTQACDGGQQDQIACENGGLLGVSSGCDFPRVPHELCDRYPWIIYFNEGNGQLGPPVMKLSPVPLESDGGDSPSGAGGFSSTRHAIVDLDGDGYLDAVSIARWDTDPNEPQLSGPPPWWWVWKGDGTGEFRGDPTGRPYFWLTPMDANPAAMYPEWSDGEGNATMMAIAGLVDLNGDGLQDYYVRDQDTEVVKVHWNNGSGFRADSEPLNGITSVSRTSFQADVVWYPDDWIVAGAATKRTWLADHDDDGRPDLVHSQSSDGVLWGSLSVRFNNGANLLGGYAPSGEELDVLWGQETVADLAGEVPQWRTLGEVLDLDGDGSAEEVWVAGNVIQKRGRPAGAPPARLMTGVDNGLGLHVGVDYVPLSDSTIVTTQPESRRASPQTKWVVKSLTTTDDFMPAGSESVVTYKYTYPIWRPDDRGEWGFRGFEKVRTTNPRGAYTEEVFGYNVDWSGRLVETITVPTEDQPSDARSPTAITSTEWARYSLFSGQLVTFHPTITRTITCNRGQPELGCRSNPAALQKSEQVWTAQGGLLYAKTSDKLQDSETQDGGDRFTTTSYGLISDLDDYRLRPTHVESRVLDGAAQTIYAATSTLWFNEYREARQEIVWLDDATTATTVRTYDAVGNVETVQKPEQAASGGPVTTFVFDDVKRFVRSTINELGHVIEAHYEPGTGVTLRTIGPNTHACHPSSCGANLGREEVRTDVDGLGRPLATWVSRDAAPGYSLVKVSEVSHVDQPSGTTTPTSTTTRNLIDWGGVSWTEERASFDGHGRLIESLVATTPQARTTYAYDEDGTLAAVTLPDPSGASATVTYRYTFDSLGRATGIERPDGSGSELAYDGTVHTSSEVTGPVGGAAAVTELIHDAFGRLVVVREKVSSGDYAETFYDYDPRGVVSRIEDADGIGTVLEHDRGGRRTKITRESRIWEYVYDRNDNLRAEISPVPGNDPELIPAYTTLYAYDALDRLTSRVIATRDVSEGDLELLGINEITYRYDVPGDGLNRIGRLSETETLDPLGNTVLRKRFTYDAQGNTTEDRLTYLFADVSGERRVKTNYGPGGKVVEVDYGDGASTDVTGTIARYSFDERANPSRLETKLTNSGSFSTQAEFIRNPSGLVTQRLRNGSPSQNAMWTYDQLGRITSQSVYAGSTKVADQLLTYWGSDDPKTLSHSGYGIEQRDFAFFYDDRHELAEVTTDDSSFASSYAFTPGGRLSHATVNALEADGSDVRNRDVDYIYQASDPEMLTSLVGPDGTFATYDYDDAGNVIARQQEQVKTLNLWDGDDQLRRSESGTGREEYYYYPDGNRVALVKRELTNGLWPSTQVKLFHGPLEIWLAPDGSTTHRLAHVGMGTSVARIRSEAGVGPSVELQYHSTLQSLLVAVGADGSVNASFAYGPYGEVLEESGMQTGSHRRRYNDKHKDELTGLSYYGYRYYDSAALLWTSADPAFRFEPDESDDAPRLANLYTFNLNNPLAYIDPDGLQASGAGARPPRPARARGSGQQQGPRLTVTARGNLGQLRANASGGVSPGISGRGARGIRPRGIRPSPGERGAKVGVTSLVGRSSGASNRSNRSRGGGGGGGGGRGSDNDNTKCWVGDPLPPVGLHPDLAATVVKPRGGENSRTAYGRRAHSNYGTALGSDHDTKVTLPSGKKPDAVNWGTREVRELKPDNARAVRRGERQVEEYRRELEQMTGDLWKSYVDTYRAPKKE